MSTRNVTATEVGGEFPYLLMQTDARVERPIRLSEERSVVSLLCVCDLECQGKQCLSFLCHLAVAASQLALWSTHLPAFCCHLHKCIFTWRCIFLPLWDLDSCCVDSCVCLCVCVSVCFSVCVCRLYLWAWWVPRHQLRPGMSLMPCRNVLSRWWSFV